MIPRNLMTPHPDVLTPRHLARIQRRAVRARQAGRPCQLRPQLLLAMCARLTQVEAELTELADTYQRLVEEHDASIMDWVRLLEVLGLSTWSSWSTVSATVVARVEALIVGVRTGDNTTDEGGA
jgi:hypothetical protein